MVKPTSFRLNPLHLRVLTSLSERLEQKHGTSFPRARVLEMAITRMWDEEVGTNIYEAFAVEEDAGRTGEGDAG